MFGNTEDRIDQTSISGDSHPVCLIPETVLLVLISYVLEPDCLIKTEQGHPAVFTEVPL